MQISHTPASIPQQPIHMMETRETFRSFRSSSYSNCQGLSVEWANNRSNKHHMYSRRLLDVHGEAILVTGRILLPRNIIFLLQALISVRGWVNPWPSAAGRIR
jgi:hypothetical protein